jgi:hypothetical protein
MLRTAGRIVVVGALASVALVLGVVPAAAQATAQISGAVTDASGGVLPGVAVTATQTATGITRTTVTNETGLYVLASLPVGPYKLEASLQGFRTFVQTGLVLQVNSNPVINVSLSVGQVAETVTVQAQAPQVETRSVGVSTVIGTATELPLNARQSTDLITLSGLAVQTGSAPAYTMNTGVNISVAGSTSYSVQYNLDGASHLDVYSGTGMPLPFPDTLQEFRVITGGQEAASGGHAGAAVNAVTKSGTNQVRGDVFWFGRDSALNGQDPFQPSKDGLKRNQFGGVVGGPIRENKLFYFVGYQGTTTRQTPAQIQAFVPTAAMRAGDFSAYIANKCPGAAGLGRGAFGPGVIANGRLTLPLSPAALNISSRLPQTSDPCGAVYTGNILHENQFQVPAKLDYQLNTKHSLFARYMVTGIDTVVPYELSPNDVLTVSGIGTNDRAQSLTGGFTSVLSAKVVNSFRVFRNWVDTSHPGPKYFGPQDVGINAYTYVEQSLPVFVPGAFSLGAPSNFISDIVDTHGNYGVNDDVTTVRGSHQIAFGGNFMRSNLNSSANAWSRGFYQFAPVFTGLAVADFLTGLTTFFRQGNPNPENISQNFFALYAQDTWRAGPKLTVNVGVRWNPFLPMQFDLGDVYTFSLDKYNQGVKSTVIPTAPAGFNYPGDPGFNGNAGMDRHWGNVEPRAGVAWDLSGEGTMVIRASGSIANDFMRQDLHENTSSVTPFRLNVAMGGVRLDNPYATFAGGNPFPYTYNSQNPVFPTQIPFQNFFPIPPDLKTTKQYSWNVGFQRQITSSLFASATYVGTRLANTWTAVELNPGQYIPGNCVAGQYGLTAPGPCSNTNNVNQRRLLYLQDPVKSANLGYMTQLDDGGSQRYNGLLLNMTWRHGRSVNLAGNYTWSSCYGLPVTTLTNTGANYLHQPYQNNGANDINLDMGPCSSNAVISSLDVRHVGNVTLVINTPTLAGNAARQLGSGWTFATVIRANSGQPLTPYIGSDRALNGFNAAGALPIPQRPNQQLDDVAAPNRGQDCLPGPCVAWVNPAAYALPAVGAYGNTGVGSLRGPAFWQWDQAVSRQFRVGMTQQIELRVEAFNVTDSLRLGNPITAMSDARFGTIVSSNGGPRVMQIAVKYIF